MSLLYGSLSISVRALLADQAAMETVSNNIANVNTPGYSRRRVVFQEGATFGQGSQTRPGGVEIQKVESLRDKVLELRTIDEVQQQSKDQTIADSLSTVETLFGEGTGFIGSELDGFFSSVSQLTTDPNNAALRQGVLTSANNVADSVKKTYQQLASAQQNVDRNVVQTVASINQLTQQIAAINVQVANKEKLGQDPGALADQRGELVRQLSGLVDVSVIDSGEGLTLTTSSGSPLVVGDKSYDLTLGTNQSGQSDIFSDGKNITAKVSGGKLGGFLQVRDASLPGLLNKLDTFAYSFSNAVNAAHTAGFDASGNPGQNLFVAPTQVSGAASSMAVAITNTQLVAASASASGGNGNLQNILAVKNAHISGGMTPGTFYSSMVFDIGDQVKNAQADADAGSLHITQLDDQRGAISSVSLDEEATNLIRYQQAFQAAARVIDVINQLTETVVNLGR